ncbi:MAG: xanthine dehydrogenase family protein subunit M [Clostridia bacterium]|nr:xanthine dehydrogenase family protein subunit M [Clostridia bacterium]
MSTRLLDREFEYVAPNSLADALDLLSAYEGGVKVMAGGTDLLVKLKTGADIPFSILLDTKDITELSFISKCEEGIEIGALTKLCNIDRNTMLSDYHALVEAIPLMASPAVRNMGTIGGNIVNASPAADTACPLMVYDAVLRLSSASGDREVPISKFFTGVSKTVIKDDEMLVSIVLPRVKPDSGSCFIKKTRVKPDISKISVTAYIERDGSAVKACRIAMGAVAPTPIELLGVGDKAFDRVATKELFLELAELAASIIKPIDDIRSTAEYRREISKVLVAQALETAWQRAGGTL